jgi:hypothetical protein
MALTTTNGVPVTAFCPSAPDAMLKMRRRISPRAGRALRALRHAIEYLANEFLSGAVPPGAQNGQFQAVQMLMVLNRKVYEECPEELDTPKLSERCRQLLKLGRG